MVSAAQHPCHCTALTHVCHMCIGLQDAATLTMQTNLGLYHAPFAHNVVCHACNVRLCLLSGGAFGGQQADMFGGLSLEAPAAASGQTGMDALMGLASPQPPAQSPSAAGAADLFGGLSLGGKDQ